MLKKFCEELKKNFKKLKSWVKWGEVNPSDASDCIGNLLPIFGEAEKWIRPKVISKMAKYVAN